MAFEPGNQLHLLGRKAKRITEALDRAILQEDGKRIREGVDKLLDAFADGEPWAIQMVWDRHEGKPTQSTDLSIVKTEIKSFTINELARIIDDQRSIIPGEFSRQIEGGEGAGVAIEAGVGTAGPGRVESPSTNTLLQTGTGIPVELSTQESGTKGSNLRGIISYDDIPTL